MSLKKLSKGAKQWIQASSTVAVSITCAPILALSAPEASFKTCDFARSHFSIKLPATWKTRNDVILPVVAAPKEVINTTNELPSVKVRVRPAEEGLTLKSLGDGERKQWGTSWNVKSDTTTKNSAPARALQTRTMIIETMINGKRLKVMTLFAISKGNCFIVTCSDTPDRFPQNKMLFSKILSSFCTL